ARSLAGPARNSSAPNRSTTERGRARVRPRKRMPSVEVSSRGFNRDRRVRVHRIKQVSLGPERSAVQRRVPVALDGGAMFGGGVALVAVVTVARVALVMGHHLAVACHLGDDGCRSNRGAAAIAV